MRALPLLTASLLVLSGCGGSDSGSSTGSSPGSSSGAPYDQDGHLLVGKAPTERTNVLFISIDTLRADHLGCYGYARETSPHLDALAEDALVFDEAVAAAPWTTPAHLSLMTSMYPEVHGVLAYPNPGTLHPRVVTLAEILSSAGWNTAGFTEGGYAKGSTGLADGFQSFPSWPRDEDSFVSHELEPSRLLENTERALTWLRAHAAEPFFLFFHTYEPHFEYRPPLADLLALDPAFNPESEEAALGEAVEAWNARAELSPEQKGVLYRHYLQGNLLRHEVRRQKRLWPMLTRFVEDEWHDSPAYTRDLAAITLLYDAEIHATDAAIGRILSELDALGLAETTLVVLTSDHGEGLMDHDELQHGFHLYDELLHIPLLLRLPGDAHPPAHLPGTVRSIDILPTILDALALPAPRFAQGASLLPLATGASSPPRTAFAEGLTIRGGERNLAMVQRGRWKLIRDTKRGRDYLFDLERDPAERTNLLSSADPSLVADLTSTLDRILATNHALAERFPVAEGTLDDAERQRLQALGYAGAPDEPAEPSETKD